MALRQTVSLVFRNTMDTQSIPTDPETWPAAAVRTYQLEEEVTVQEISVISQLPSQRQDFH